MLPQRRQTANPGSGRVCASPHQSGLHAGPPMMTGADRRTCSPRPPAMAARQVTNPIDHVGVNVAEQPLTHRFVAVSTRRVHPARLPSDSRRRRSVCKGNQHGFTGSRVHVHHQSTVIFHPQALDNGLHSMIGGHDEPPILGRARRNASISSSTSDAAARHSSLSTLCSCRPDQVGQYIGQSAPLPGARWLRSLLDVLGIEVVSPAKCGSGQP